MGEHDARLSFSHRRVGSEMSAHSRAPSVGGVSIAGFMEERQGIEPQTKKIKVHRTRFMKQSYEIDWR